MTNEELVANHKSARERIDVRRADSSYARRPIDDTMDQIVAKTKNQTAAVCEGKPLAQGDGMLGVEALMENFTWDEKMEADILMQEAIESYHAEKTAKSAA